VDPSELDARRERFEALAPSVIDAVRRYLARRTDPATADDVLSETLLVCWRRLDDVPDVPLPWAYGVARNCLANAARGDRRRMRLAARLAVVDPPRPVPAAEAPDTDLAEALARLRTAEAEILRLWAWEDLGPTEIAAVLGISANAASIRLHRAKGTLRDELRKLDAPVGHEQSTEGTRP
jgi:RNA polymerase sigma-70 factor (ECF subfamily)